MYLMYIVIVLSANNSMHYNILLFVRATSMINTHTLSEKRLYNMS